MVLCVRAVQIRQMVPGQRVKVRWSMMCPVPDGQSGNSGVTGLRLSLFIRSLLGVKHFKIVVYLIVSVSQVKNSVRLKEAESDLLSHPASKRWRQGSCPGPSRLSSALCSVRDELLASGFLGMEVRRELTWASGGSYLWPDPETQT